MAIHRKGCGVKYITELSKEFRFEAAHSLPRVPPDHKCARVHGHSYAVVVRVSGPVDPHMGWLIDYADLDRAFAPLRERLDHRYLNDVDGLENPTCEAIAAWILGKLDIPGAHISSITVKETPTSHCTLYVAPH